MALKNDLLEKLEQHRGCVFSGEALATEFCVSRAAVCKAIGALKKQGHIISGVPHKGYTMSSQSDLLTQSGIRFFLGDAFDAPIHVLDTVNSTNSYARQLVEQGTKNGTIVVSDEQTGGRGRFGRSFFSQKGGVYMSVILTDSFDAENSVLLTISACVAVCKSLEKLTGQDFSIKWVNDIYYKNRKLCGILTEAVTDFETGTVSGAIVGIGINISAPKTDLPAELADKIGSLDGFDVPRNQLVAAVAAELLKLQHNLCDPSLIEYYTDRSFLLGKRIEYVKNGVNVCATAVGITDKGALTVRLDGGETLSLASGEVSAKAAE